MTDLHAETYGYTPVAPGTWRWKQSVRWLVLPSLLLFVLMPILVAFAGDPSFWPAAILAYFNWVLGATAVFLLARRGSVGSVIPIIFLAFLSVSLPLSTLYFMVAVPDLNYTTMSGTYYHLDAALRVQAITCVFMVLLVGVLGMAGMFRSRVTPEMPANIVTRRFALLSVFMGGFVLLLNAGSKVVHYPSLLGYVADGSYNYLCGIFIIVGALWRHYRKTEKMGIVLLLLAVGGFYTLGNARGLALQPIVFTLIGALFLGSMTGKGKLLLLNVGSALIAAYLVIGNTTRAILGSVGFRDIAVRLQALTQWREVFGDSSVLTSTFGRLFPVGGHAIITQTPESVPYMDATLFRYIFELITRILIPGRIYYNVQYSDPSVLLRYGFFIYEGNSVDVTTIGSLWILGGWVPLIAGTIALAVVIAGLALWLDRTSMRNPYLPLFILAMLGAALIQSPNATLIMLLRAWVIRCFAALVLWYVLVRPFIYRGLGQRY